jgi:hypothetical protein
MVSKYPQKTPSPGTPIWISQFRVAVRVITNKRSTSTQIFFLSVYHRLIVQMRFSMLKIDFGVHLHPRNLALASKLAIFKLQC